MIPLKLSQVNLCHLVHAKVKKRKQETRIEKTKLLLSPQTFASVCNQIYIIGAKSMQI